MPARRKSAWARAQAAAPEPPPTVPEEPPLWVRQLREGLRHVAGRAPGDPVVTEDLKRDLAVLREARARWWAARGGKPAQWWAGDGMA